MKNDKKYKIAIDVSPLSNGNSIRGVGYYTRNLVDALQHEIKTNPDFSDFEIKLITQKSELTNDINLTHYPYFDPFFLTLPSTSKPFVVSVHDLIPLEHKNLFPIGPKGFIKWQIQKHRLKKARYIITISHTSKYVIHDILSYPKDKIFTTYLAADKTFRPIKDQIALNSIKQKYQLPDKFVLYVGDLNPNKNIPRLAKACQQIKVPLIIVGASAVKQVPKDKWTIDIHWVQEHQSKYLKSIGYVDDNDLPALYNLATVYCQPSIAEGFGLPLVQAMQSGAPTCYSKNTALDEISDFSGVAFDPYSIDDMSQKLKQVITNPGLRQELVTKGLERASHFSWQLCAINTLTIYRLCQLNDQK